MELRSISEEERVKSGLTRAKLGGLSKAEIMEMVTILFIPIIVLYKRPVVNRRRQLKML